MGTMFLKYSGRRELAEFMPDHVLGHKDRDERLTIVNHESVPDEIRRDHGTTGPCLHRLLDSGGVHLVDLLEKMRLHKRSLF